MAKKIIAFLLLSTLLLSGCGGNMPATVHASTPGIADVGPDSFVCGSIDGGDRCAWVHHIKDATGNVLGYCQGDVYMWPGSMSFHLEIGLNQLIADQSLSNCPIFVPRPASIVNLRGNLALLPWTGNNTSIATWLYAVKAGQKEVLHVGKIQAIHSVESNLAFQGDAGQNLVFNSQYQFDALLFCFNNDLPGSTPLTISVAGAGDIE
jgi:hypothetical protein